MNQESFSSTACADFADLHGLPLITIQTHHAHALACMAEHGLTHALALVMNRGSAGPDGTEWGSECIESRLDGFSRLAAFQPLHQEKGRPARHFLEYLISRRLEPSRELLTRIGVDDAEYELWRKQPVPHDNLTHSALGLINAVCAGIGIIPDFCTYPDRALLLLRKYASRFPRGSRVPDKIAVQFQFKYSEENGFRQIDWSDTMLNLANIPRIDESEKVLYAEAFYNALAESMLAMGLFAESRTGFRNIVLSGSLFQDPIFHSKTCARLEARSFHVFSHISLAGDESCVPVGQAYAAGLSEGL
jgi:hydrogenase maturation protein HypF